MRFDDATISKRRVLWCALSDLFLDNELQAEDFASIAKKMKASGYTLDEIQDILMLEVFPVCILNLYSVAGIWTGFEEESLIESITSAKHPNRFKQWIHRRSFGMIKDDWNELVKRFNKL